MDDHRTEDVPSIIIIIVRLVVRLTPPPSVDERPTTVPVADLACIHMYQYISISISISIYDGRYDTVLVGGHPFHPMTELDTLGDVRDRRGIHAEEPCASRKAARSSYYRTPFGDDAVRSVGAGTLVSLSFMPLLIVLSLCFIFLVDVNFFF